LQYDFLAYSSLAVKIIAYLESNGGGAYVRLGPKPLVSNRWRRCRPRADMLLPPRSAIKMRENHMKIIALAVLFLAFTSVMASGQLEMGPGEEQAEMLFQQGIGQPWVGGRPPWQGESLFLPYRWDVARNLYYTELGLVQVEGYLRLGEEPRAVSVPYDPGWYRVLGCYDQGHRIVGVYVDLGGYYSDQSWI